MVIEGIVEQGKHLGRRLGFPTANIAPKAVAGKWPSNGVYAAAFWLDGDGRAWPGMLNQGVHPTAPEGKPTVEVHVIGFSGDIYGRHARVEYLRFLRPERRFDSLEALTEQLARDRAEVLDWIQASMDAEERRINEIDWHFPLSIYSRIIPAKQ